MLKLFSAVLVLMGLQAQTTNVQNQPQCVLSFQLSANGNSQPFDNRFWGCNSWIVTYEVYSAGITGISATFQQGTSNSAGTGASGTWSTFASSPLSGSNPSTSNPASVSFQGYAPWVRLNVAGLVGTVRGMVLGCRLPCSLSAGSGGGGGGSTTLNSVCNLRATISANSSGNNAIVAPVAGQTITVCHISMSYASSLDWSLTQGTGAACGTGTTAVTGTYQTITGIALDRDLSPFVLTSGNGLCVNNSSAVNGGGVIVYKQQ